MFGRCRDAFLGALWLTSIASLSCPLFRWLDRSLSPMAVRRRFDSPVRVGMVLIVATTGLLWKRRIALREAFLGAGILAVLSVQCMYQNAFLLLGICAAGVTVSLWARIRRRRGGRCASPPPYPCSRIERARRAQS